MRSKRDPNLSKLVIDDGKEYLLHNDKQKLSRVADDKKNQNQSETQICPMDFVKIYPKFAAILIITNQFEKNIRGKLKSHSCSMTAFVHDL